MNSIIVTKHNLLDNSFHRRRNKWPRAVLAKLTKFLNWFFLKLTEGPGVARGKKTIKTKIKIKRIWEIKNFKGF